MYSCGTDQFGLFLGLHVVTVKEQSVILGGWRMINFILSSQEMKKQQQQKTTKEERGRE